MSFVLHLTFEDAYECMVGQVKNNDMYGNMFQTAPNYEFELYKKPKETGWFKVPFRKPKLREFTRNELNGMFSVDVEGTWNTGTSWSGTTQQLRQPTVSNVSATPGNITFHHDHIQPRMSHQVNLQQAMNNHIAEHARQVQRAEAERREAQRISERDRLEAERNRPSFLRRINPFR